MAMTAIIQEQIVEGHNELLRRSSISVTMQTKTKLSLLLAWWKSHVKTVGQDAAHRMSWNTIMKMMTAKMFPEESDKIKNYVGGLPDMIHGSVMASKTKTMQDAVEFATELMDKKICTFVERPTLLGLGRRSHMGDLSHCALNATITMMECGNQGHYRSDCLELKNQNHGNQAGGTGACGMVHALGGGETNKDLHNMENDINA
nr:hypothetical protein [Tanacetum cinerariifolium]